MGEMSPHVVWQQYGVLLDLLSIDESMVLYCGRQSCKMFIKDKPIRYPYHLILHQNKEPLGLQVAGEIISVVEQYPEPTHRELFFDNFLTAMAYCIN